MSPVTRFADRPVAAAVLGAVAIASSGVLVRLADVDPGAAAAYRCLYALPALAVLARYESRSRGPLPRAARRAAWGAGLFFAVDLVLWHHAINFVGAGLATVLGNLQVVVVGVLAWLLFGERPSRQFLFGVPLLLTGVVLVSGVIGAGAYGDNPGLGVVFGLATSLAYAGFLLTLRHGGSGDIDRPAGLLVEATAVSAVVSVGYGLVVAPGDLVPSWPAHGWLVVLALTAQVAGWMLISVSLPRLPAAVTSVILLLQPVCAVALAAVTIGETPSIAQLAGCALVLAGVIVATSRRRAGPDVAVQSPVPVPSLDAS